MRRTRQIFGVLAAALCVFASSLAGAEPPPALAEARALYAEGRCDDAARAAETAGGAGGYALGARAVLAQALLLDEPDEIKRRARQAEALAEKALAEDPEHVEALLQAAIAVGVRGRHTGALSAHFQGLASRGLRRIEKALRIAPDDPWAMSVMGAWHLEVVRRGGARFYGARIEDGVRWYEAALAADPNNGAIAYRFALSLMALERPELEPRARDALRQAIEAPTQDALSLALQRRARELASAVAAGASAAALVRAAL